MLTKKRNFDIQDSVSTKRVKGVAFSALSLKKMCQVEEKLIESLKRNLSFEESTHNKKQRSRPRPKKEPEKPIKFYSQSEVDHLLEVEREICQRKINEIMKQYQDTVQELVIPMNKNISYIS